MGLASSDPYRAAPRAFLLLWLTRSAEGSCRTRATRSPDHDRTELRREARLSRHLSRELSFSNPGDFTNLETSIRFYSELFAAKPTKRKVEYAKWMLDDPRVNFAISQRGAAAGIEHLGIQVENPTELEEIYVSLVRAAAADSHQAACCAPSCCTPSAS